MEKREKFGSRMGFILIAAGCAIGLGNVWRFPYITGKYGGGAFVVLYLVFLLVMGLPAMIMELAVGRASQKSVGMSFDVLEQKGSKWHLYKYVALAGNYLLMMFYTTVAAWLLIYCVKMAKGDFTVMNSAQISEALNVINAQPLLTTGAVVVVITACMWVCSLGLNKGVEKITKVMMLLLLLIMFVLAGYALTMEGAGEGMAFYLKPDFNKLMEAGLSNAIFDAMGQAFFTLSIGMGSIAIFGSYIDKSRTLTGEAMIITALDTMVAITAGIIIFPACFTYGVQADAGPNLIFATLPNVFMALPGGRIWGTLFFIFLLFAALSTVIGVFENIISWFMDFGMSRKKSSAINLVLLIILSLPCVLGFNVLSGIQPLGAGSTIMDLEDFIVSNNILPIGSLIYLTFCTSKLGWGWKSFIDEVNTGNGIKFPNMARIYVSYIMPLIILYIFLQGYIAKFFA